MFKSIIDATVRRSSVMFDWKRRAWSKTQLSSEHYRKLPHYCAVLEKSGMFSSPALARRYLVKNRYIFDVPSNHLLQAYAVFHKWRIDVTTLPHGKEFLSMPLDTLENTIMILDEIGVRKIHAVFLSRFSRLVLMRLALFKAFTGVPEFVNITQTIMRYLGPYPPDAPPLPTVSEDSSVLSCRVRCLEWYLNWRLNLSDTDLKMLNEDKWIEYCGRRRSFTVIKQQIDHLCDEIGLTPEQILRYGCLKKGSAVELRRVMDQVTTFAGIEMKKLIRVKPRLSSMQCENVVEVTRLLTENGFTDKMKRRFPEILLIPHQKLKKSIDILNTTPELRILKNNLRILILLQRMTIAQVRLEYFRHHSVNILTVGALTSRRISLERLLRTGVDYCKAREIGTSLARILNLDAKEIARRIKKHPFWRNVGILSMHQTVDFLLKKFPPNDIADNILLILYPKDRVAATLTRLSKMKNDSLVKNFSGKQTLAYCVYLIERDYHFTGDGVWKKPPPQEKRVFWEEIDAELSDQEDTEDDEDNTAQTYNTYGPPQMMQHRLYRRRIKRR